MKDLSCALLFPHPLPYSTLNPIPVHYMSIDILWFLSQSKV